MRRILALGAGVVLSMASAASAQVTGTVVSRTVTYSQAAPVGPHGSGGNNLAGANNASVPSSATQYFADFSGYPSYNNYQVSTAIDNAAGYIAFANNATSAGARDSMSTTTTVQVSYKNSSSNPIDPTLTSTIIPGGLGLYTGNLAANPTLTGYAPTPGDSPPVYVPIVTNLNATPLNASGSFNNAGLFSESYLQDSASFSFQILSGVNLVASYTATLAMVATQDPTTGNYSWAPVLTTNFSTPLNGFGDFPGDNPAQAVDYAWDATPVTLDLGMVAAGASSSLSYITTVSTQTYEGNEDSPDHAVVAYAGFGDPIGKASGAKGIADPSFPLLELGLPTFQTDPNTGAVTVTAATFDNVYTPSQLPITDVTFVAPPPGPEPETWVLMLLGVGLVGASRRRRAARAAA